METATRADRYTWQDKRVWFDVIGAQSGAGAWTAVQSQEAESGDMNHKTWSLIFITWYHARYT